VPLGERLAWLPELLGRGPLPAARRRAGGRLGGVTELGLGEVIDDPIAAAGLAGEEDGGDPQPGQ
jgi:hypothetical protein